MGGRVRRALTLLWETLCITGLLCLGVLVLPLVVWRWFTYKREWRQATTRGTGGYWDHPS